MGMGMHESMAAVQVKWAIVGKASCSPQLCMLLGFRTFFPAGFIQSVGCSCEDKCQGSSIRRMHLGAPPRPSEHHATEFADLQHCSTSPVLHNPPPAISCLPDIIPRHRRGGFFLS